MPAPCPGPPPRAPRTPARDTRIVDESASPPHLWMNLGNVGHMRIALAQMELSAEPQENLGAAKDVIVRAGDAGADLVAVSYTHLTLPTIYSV